LSTKLVYCDSSAIPSLAGTKKSFPNAKPRVDCWRQPIPSNKSNVERKSVNVRVNIPDEKNAFSYAQTDREIEDLAEESADLLLTDSIILVDARNVSKNKDLPDEDLNDEFEYVPGTDSEKRDLPDEDSSNEDYSNEDNRLDDQAEESADVLVTDATTLIDARNVSENKDLPEEDLNDAYEYSFGTDGESENLPDEHLHCRTNACNYDPGTDSDKQDLPDEVFNDECYGDEDLDDEYYSDEDSWPRDPDLNEFDFSLPFKMNKMPQSKPRFNLSTKIVYYDSSAIPPLAGTKKYYPNASPRVDCWSKLFSPPESHVHRKRIAARKAQMPKVYLDWLEKNPKYVKVMVDSHHRGMFFYSGRALDTWLEKSKWYETAEYKTWWKQYDGRAFLLVPSPKALQYEKDRRFLAMGKGDTEIDVDLKLTFELANLRRRHGEYDLSMCNIEKVEKYLSDPSINIPFWKSVQPYIDCWKAEFLAGDENSFYHGTNNTQQTREALQLVENVLADTNAIRFYDYATFVQIACKFFLEAQRANEYGDPEGVDDLGIMRELYEEFNTFVDNLPKSYDFFEELKGFGTVHWGKTENWLGLAKIVENSMNDQNNKLHYRLLGLKESKSRPLRKEFDDAFKKKLIKYYPDKFTDESKEVQAEQKKKLDYIRDAYHELLQWTGFQVNESD
jgi:hypothetical protein